MHTDNRLIRALTLVAALALVVSCSNGRRGGGTLPRDAGASDAGVGAPHDAGSLPPGVDAGSVPPGVDAGRPPGVDAGVVGACSNLSGSYSLTGDCEVTFCNVTQDGCGVTVACDGPVGTLTGTIAGTSVSLLGPGAMCLVDLDTRTGVLSGTCSVSALVCGFDATPI